MAEKETLALGRDVPTDSAAPLAEVFTLSYRRLAMQLYGVVGNLAEAEDLVQEAFVRAAAAGTQVPAGRQPGGLAAPDRDQPAPEALAQGCATSTGSGPGSRSHRRTCPGWTSTSP